MAGTSREYSAAAVADVRMQRVIRCLRVGAAGCFIGHGAFGMITKAAWLPYFAVVGIDPHTAYNIMPLVGAIDILAGFTVLLSPRPIVLLYMSVWALWTALLRPLAGESVFEAVERAGNYAVPFALLLLTGVPRKAADWFANDAVDVVRASTATVAEILRWTTSLLLFGHGVLEAITRKPVFIVHYAAIGLPASIAPALGWIEMVVAVLVLFVPSVGLLVAIAVWKIATEALYPISGTPIWEFLERAGSYAAPLALALLSLTTRLSSITTRRSSK